MWDTMLATRYRGRGEDSTIRPEFSNADVANLMGNPISRRALAPVLTRIPNKNRTLARSG